MTEELTIILPLPKKVLSPNAPSYTIGGRYAKAAATKKYRRIAKEAVEAEQIDTAPWAKVLVEVTFFHKTNHRRDPDNSTGSIKAVYDGIVDSGLVPDDDKKHMRRQEPDYLVDKESPRVELTITRLK